MASESEWRSRLALIAACTILVAWAVSFALDIWVETYDPHPSITPLALATVGWLFGGEVVARIKSDDQRDDEAETKEIEQ